jgi:hypothetical protein
MKRSDTQPNVTQYNDPQHNDTQHTGQIAALIRSFVSCYCRLFTVMLNVIVLSFDMLSARILSAIMLSVNILSVVDSLTALLTNVRLGYDGSLGTKHSSLFVQSISDEETTFNYSFI